jgi:hypothetical protein
MSEDNNTPDDRSDTSEGAEEPKNDVMTFDDVESNGDVEVDESSGNKGSVEGDDTPEGSDDCEKRLEGIMMPGGNVLGLNTRIVVVASGSTVFRMVVLLKYGLVQSEVKVTYLHVIMFVVVEYAVTTVLSSVGALLIVIGTLKGSGVKVVFAVIGVTISRG